MLLEQLRSTPPSNRHRPLIVPATTSLAHFRTRCVRSQVQPKISLNVCAALVLQARYRVYIESYNIGVPELRVLVRLCEFGMMTAEAIVNYSNMHKTKLSRAVALLERRKVASRHLNRVDLREASLSLTTAGREIYNKLAPIAIDFARQQLDTVDGADRAALDRALRKLTECSAQPSADIAKRNGLR